MPIWMVLPLNFLPTTSLVFSEMGIRPSTNNLVMRGMSSITAPMVTPRNRMSLRMRITASVVLVPADRVAR